MNVNKKSETPAERFLMALAAVEDRDGTPTRQLALRLRMDPSALSHYRSGRTASVSPRILIDAERQLGISRHWVETGTGSMFREGDAPLAPSAGPGVGRGRDTGAVEALREELGVQLEQWRHVAEEREKRIEALEREVVRLVALLDGAERRTDKLLGMVEAQGVAERAAPAPRPEPAGSPRAKRRQATAEDHDP